METTNRDPNRDTHREANAAGLAAGDELGRRDTILGEALTDLRSTLDGAPNWENVQPASGSAGLETGGYANIQPTTGALRARFRGEDVELTVRPVASLTDTAAGAGGATGRGSAAGQGS